MGKDFHEQEFDDQVYEDGYYRDNYDEEELEDDSDHLSENEYESDIDWDEEKRIHLSFACEDCDYRWDDQIIKIKGNLEDEIDDLDIICPMCGSMNVSQI